MDKPKVVEKGGKVGEEHAGQVHPAERRGNPFFRHFPGGGAAPPAPRGRGQHVCDGTAPPPHRPVLRPRGPPIPRQPASEEAALRLEKAGRHNEAANVLWCLCDTELRGTNQQKVLELLERAVGLFLKAENPSKASWMVMASQMGRLDPERADAAMVKIAEFCIAKVEASPKNPNAEDMLGVAYNALSGVSKEKAGPPMERLDALRGGRAWQAISEQMDEDR